MIPFLINAKSEMRPLSDSWLHCYVCLKYKGSDDFYGDCTRSSQKSSKCKVCCDLRKAARKGRVG